jgi:hypothetical protein
MVGDLERSGEKRERAVTGRWVYRGKTRKQKEVWCVVVAALGRPVVAAVPDGAVGTGESFANWKYIYTITPSNLVKEDVLTRFESTLGI